MLFVQSARAAEGDGRRPYELDIVLRLADHPVLTDAFRARLEREVRAQVRLALGKLARVKLVKQHPLLAKIDEHGLEALDGWHELTGKTTAFVLVDYRDGRYEIAARQHDGLTGLASPLRQVKVVDRLLVARTAALLIDGDFGLVGTVDKGDHPGEVTIALRGGQLGDKLRARVAKDRVFALVQINNVGGEQQALRVPWTLLQVTAEPDDQGRCRCRVWQRYRDSLARGPALVEQRALLLSTARGPLHMRLVDDARLRPLADQSVTVAEFGFDAPAVEKLLSDSGGLVDGTHAFRHVAFVKVMDGSTVRARVPVALIRGQTPVCPMSVDPRAETLGRLDLHKKQWQSRVRESVLVVDQLYKELSKLVDGQAHKEALERAGKGLVDLRRDLAGRNEELSRLRGLARQLAALDALDVVEGEQRLRELVEREKELVEFIDNTRAVIRQANDPRRAELLGMIERARLLETEAEYDKALTLYNQIVERAGKEPKLLALMKKRLDELREAWKLRGGGAEHGQARKFVYQVWTRIESPAELRGRIDQAVRMFNVCQQFDDRLTPRMLLKANLRHANRLKQRLEALRPRSREDDRREAEIIADVSGRLQKLTEDVSSYLSPPKKEE